VDEKDSRCLVQTKNKEKDLRNLRKRMREEKIVYCKARGNLLYRKPSWKAVHNEISCFYRVFLR
jgi:hypothetical protein